MDHKKFAIRLLSVLAAFAFLGFTAEAVWEFSRAVHPVTGAPLRLADLEISANMVRAVASPFARAYNNILALLLTFISLAVPLTANLYTPKLVEIFIRDRINLIVLGTCSLMAAHSLFAITLSFDNWTPELPFWVGGIGAICGWLILLPYYYYVLGFLDPHTIIVRVHRGLVQELDAARRGRGSVREQQFAVNQRIVNLGSVLQRSVDRADRDVSFDAIRAHIKELRRVREIKPRLDPKFFEVSNNLLTGLSSDAAAQLSADRVWMEHRLMSQLVLAFRTALSKMPDGVSGLCHEVKNAAHEQARLGEEQVYALLVRVLNTFLREAILKKDNAPAYYVVYNYKTLIRRLLVDQPQRTPHLVTHLCYYAEFARNVGLSFIYELISYELAELTELAYSRQAESAPRLLSAMLNFQGVERSAGLVKSRAILAGYFREEGLAAELEQLLASLRTAPPALLESARRGIVETDDPVFWEVTDRGTNFDYVTPARRAQVSAVFEGLLPA